MSESLLAREDEVAHVQARLRAGGRVAVVGEAGIGKTTLLRAVSAGHPAPVFAGNALATLRWYPYLPVSQALRRPVPDGDAAAVAAWVGRTVRTGVLVLDDLHWADSATLGVLPLLPAPVVLCLGLRADGPGGEAARRAARAAGCELVEVRALGPGDSAELVRRHRPDLPDEVRERIVASAGGNPFLLVEQALSGTSSPGLRAVVADRLDACTPPAREALAALGLLGRPVSPAFVGRVLPELVAASLVMVAGEQVSVRHGLLAEAAVARLPPDVRRRLHARLADVLSDPGERARHLAAAGRSDEARRDALAAAAETRHPGRQAAHLVLAADCSTGAEAHLLRLDAAAELLTAGDAAAAQRCAEAVVASQPAGRPVPGGAGPDAVARAQLLLARVRGAVGDLDGARRHLLTALVVPRSELTSLEVELRIEQARVAVADPRSDTAVMARLAEEALVLAAASGVETPRATLVRGLAQARAGDPAAVHELTRACSAARAAGRHDVELAAAEALAAAVAGAGDLAGGRGAAEAARRRAGEYVLRRWEIRLTARLCWFDLLAGRYEDLWREAAAVLAAAPAGRDRELAQAALALSLADTGEVEQALTRLHLRGVPAASVSPLAAWVRAEVEWQAGRPAGALAWLSGTVDPPPSEPVAAAAVWPLLAWSLWETGRRMPADPVQDAPRHPFALAAAEEEAAVRLLAAGHPGQAADAFAAAAQRYDGQAVRGQVRCRWAEGEAARLAGDTESAVARLDGALALAESARLVPLQGRARRSLRALGVSRGPLGSASRPDAPAGLSRREHDVMRLVAQGLDTAAIAGRLSVTPATVDSQIRSAMRKLNARNRRQAALLATGQVDG